MESMEASKPKTDPHLQPTVEDVSRALRNAEAGAPQATSPVLWKPDSDSDEESQKRPSQPSVSISWLDAWCKRVNRALQREDPDLPLVVIRSLLTADTGPIALLVLFHGCSE